MTTAPSEPALPSLLDHGVVGNGRILALIAPTGAVEWLCMPRFDSGSLFGRLVDRENGGVFTFLASDTEVKGTLSYLPNTNVLVTRFEREDCAWEIVDFAPRLPEGLRWHAPARLVRVLRPIRGNPLLTVRFDIRPEYGEEQAEIWERPRSLDIRWPGGRATLSTSVPIGNVRGGHPFVLDRPQFFALD